jgi:hypothetical protein
MEKASNNPSGYKNFEVTLRFLENSWTLAHADSLKSGSVTLNKKLHCVKFHNAASPLRR